MWRIFIQTCGRCRTRLNDRIIARAVRIELFTVRALCRAS